MRTIAIMAGTAAAGAAVGGLTGGRKGAAIGAAAGAAGGFIYDRARRNDDASNGPASSSGNAPTEDLVSRYGSPSFLGR
jgi:hypothetical protein